jgi:hypothetical protein
MDTIRMNMAIAVPQLFYDLIARVFPGFLFLFMVWSLPNVSIDGIWLANVLPGIPDNFWGSLYFGIAYFVFSYYVGWILGILSGISPLYKYGVDHKLSHHPEDISKNSIPLKIKYQKIRLANENVGFRIVKLRAEAKMLEASRTGLCLVAALMLLIFTYKYLFERLDYWHLLNQFILFLAPLIVAIIFQKSIAVAVERYIGNIEAHYDQMFRVHEALDYNPNY